MSQTSPKTIQEARAFIRRHFARVVSTEEIDRSESHGRIMAGDVVAPANLPRFDSSAMDGYAVRTSDLRIGQPTRLKLAGRSAAGHPAAAGIGSKEAIRVFTGAVMPAGADRVLKQEDCRESGGWVWADFKGSGKSHVRKCGEDYAKGSLAVKDGTRLGFGHLALFGSFSIRSVTVYRRLKVALFSTGDELRQSTAISAGLIGDANRPMLHSLFRAIGCIVNDGGIVPDRVELLTEVLREAAQDNDVIITTGGMSVGDEDHLTTIIRSRGCLEFWRLNVRPGKPVGFGDIDDCPILGLPGNPVAALTTFLLLGLPLLARLAGDGGDYPHFMRLQLLDGITKNGDYMELIPAVVRASNSGTSGVAAIKHAGSAKLSALVAADGLIILPECETFIEPGRTVDFLSFRSATSR